MVKTRVRVLQMTILSSNAIDVGEQIHKRVMAEGGYMVHVDDKSWFEKYDRTSGEFSRQFSAELMELIRLHRSSLKIYAAWRRSCGTERPPAVGSSNLLFRPQSPRAGVQIAVTATRIEERNVHELACGSAAGGMAAGGRDGTRDGVNGGFSKFFAPHGASTGEEGGRK